MIAIECELVPGELIHNIADAHIYLNHLEQVNTQLSRIPTKAPTLNLHDDLFHRKGLMYFVDNHLKEKTLDEIKTLIWVDDYEPQGFLKAPVAVRKKT